MVLGVVLFASGVLVLYQLPDLPGWGVCLAVAVAAGASSSSAHMRHVAPFLLGFAWALGHALLTYPDALPEGVEHGTFVVHGDVVSLPETRDGFTRFALRARSLGHDGTVWHGDWRLRLSWKDAPALAPGDGVVVSARLRHVHGFASPGAWDYEGWLFRQGIRYTGYVVSAPDPQHLPRVTDACCALDRWRQRIAHGVDELDIGRDSRAVIKALSIGDRSALSPRLRDVFAKTGTSHLMAISGLHIGLVAGLGFALISVLWRRIPRLPGRVPTRVAGAAGGLALGAAYALLAGMTLPTQRALIMLTVFAIALVARRRGQLPNTLALAAGCVLAWQPSAIVTAGFWLSFGAVAIIAMTLARTGSRLRWRRVIVLQLALGIGLWPLLVVFDLPTAPLAPVVNLVLIPVFGFTVVPLSLVGVSLLLPSPELGAAMLGVLDPWISLLLKSLAAVSRLEVSVHWLPLRDTVSALAVAAGMLLLLAPKGFPLRLLALPMLAISWLPRGDSPESGGFVLHVLDVGQGLSSVIQTARHTLVFDTGPAYRSGFATSSAVLVPFLRSIGRTHIDRLVVSHGDIDHAGGIGELVADMPVRQFDSGEPGRVFGHSTACRAGDGWHWDGVEFRYLHPAAGQALSGNDASCVLRVSTPTASVLLTGDIERRVEQQLVTTAATLRSDIVVAPHHGSRSSSSEAFVAATNANVVIFANGWANRYGFPATEIEQRWRSAGATPISTATAGSVSFTIRPDAGIGEPQCRRVHNRRFWWHRGGLAEGCHAVSSRGRQNVP